MRPTLPAAAAILCALSLSAAAARAQLAAGPDATVLKDGKPYRGVGVNYFDCFARTLRRGDDASYDAGFKTLAARGIPFARFAATGYWPNDMRLYRDDPREYFRRMDGVLKSAGRHGVGLIPSLFWYYACLPDLVGEPMDAWADPHSRTRQWMSRYVREVVTRYRDDPTVWAWEFGNEYSLEAGLPNAKDHRPAVHPELGTAASRGPRDDLTFAMVRGAFAAFASEVRKHDPRRLIFTGDAFLRPGAWHQEHEGAWDHDTPEQFADMLTLANPDPVNGISVHLYDTGERRMGGVMEVSRRLKKPVLVGEFGAPGETPASEEACRSLLKSALGHGASLCALWVFDLTDQKEFNVTADNARAWQLDLIAEANRELAKAESGDGRDGEGPKRDAPK